MYNKILTWIAILIIAGFMVVTMFALQKSFNRISEDINSNRTEILGLMQNQKVITDSLLDLTELLDNFAFQLFINETELEKIKQELDLPNNLKSYESIVENNGEK
tara:strand:- start:5887 stop:6201 length:315 start_codon:yes stop_codon:yes gene_type:complete